MTQAQIQVLGTISGRTPDGRQLPLGSALVQRLVAVLVTEQGRPISRDRLIEVLWADSAPEGPQNNLQVYISRLRSGWGRDAIETSTSGYALAQSVEVDASLFERLITRARSTDLADALALYDEALGLWHGRAFGSLADEWWARPSAVRLEELRVAAMAERVEVLLAVGDADRAAADSEVLLAADPLKESSAITRMRALHQSGRSAEALRVSAAFRRRLSENAGLSASPALDVLERQILDHDPDAARPTVARSVRGYVFGDLLSRGGQGSVYEATQPSLGRVVAIKVLRKDRADSPEFIRRFEAEAQFVARLEHPSIVPLYDYWREPGSAYLVFRLLRGGSLAERVARREIIAIEDVDLLVERVGDALHSAHQRGVVHRDVRAANVLYDDDGRPYLADFGIALEHASVEDAADDVAAFARMLMPLVGEGSMHQPQRSLLRRAELNEISSARELVLQWRAGRELITPTPTPDRARPRQRAGNPFVGLRVFDETDASVFFGRTTAIDEIVALASMQRFVTVVGPSGAGKSSVIRAGVTPRLRAQDYVVATMTPGVRPLFSLGVALRRVATEDQVSVHHDDVGALLRSVAGAQRTVLIVDQLEELWTQSVPDDRDAFIELLLTPELPVIATIRADFYDRPLGDRRLGPIVQKATYALTTLSPAELASAITGPLQSSGVSCEAGLVAQIIADVDHEPAPLPLVQFALSSMYDTRTTDILTLDAYEARGGVVGAIAVEAEQLYQRLEPKQQDQCRELFAELVTPGDASTDDTRRRASRTELEHINGELIERLNQLRLLTFDRDPATGEPTVEIAHEALFNHWPRLRDWTDDQREQLRARKALRDDVAAWEHAQRNSEHLYRPTRLATALERVGTSRLTATERSFIDASIEQRDREASRERRRLRRTQALLAATAGLLILALVAGALAVVQKSRADRRANEATAARDATQLARDNADVDRMTAQAQADATEEPVRAALLAVEAYRRRPSWETAGAIQAVLTQQTPGVLGYISDGGPFGLAKFGDRVIVAKDGATKLGVWDASTRKRLQSIEVGDITSIRLSPDERYVGVSTPDKVVVVDVETGRQSAQLGFGVRSTVAGFDPNDPERLAVVGNDGTVAVVHWRTGQADWRVAATLSNADTFTRDAGIVSADGRTLVTSHQPSNSIRVWAMQPGQLPATPLLTIPNAGVGAATMELSFSPDGASVAAFFFRGGIRIWRVGDGTLTASFNTVPGEAPPLGGTFLDDKTVAAQTDAGIIVFDLVTKSRVPRTLPGGNFIALNPARTAMVVRAGLAASAGAIQIVALDGRQLGARQSLLLPAGADFLGGQFEDKITVNADATRLLVFAKQPYLYDLTAANPQPQRIDFAGAGRLVMAQFTKSGRSIATLHSDAASRSASFQRWDSATFRPLGRPIALPHLAAAFGDSVPIAVSPDERLLAWADLSPPLSDLAPQPLKMLVRVYDVATGELVHTLTNLLDIGDPTIAVVSGSLSFSADGSRLAIATLNRGAYVWDLRPSPPTFVRLPTDAWTVAFSGSGEYLMTTDFTSSSTRFYDAATLAPRDEPIAGRAVLRALPNPTVPFALTDSNCNFSTLNEGLGRLVSLWDVERSRELGKGSVLNCGFWFPDGRSYGAISGNAIQIFDFSQESWIATACQFAGRDLSAAEWARFGPDKPYRKTCTDR